MSIRTLIADESHVGHHSLNFILEHVRMQLVTELVGKKIAICHDVVAGTMHEGRNLVLNMFVVVNMYEFQNCLKRPKTARDNMCFLVGAVNHKQRKVIPTSPSKLCCGQL